MSQRYSQSRATWAIIRASFKAILAVPTSIIFSILFPVIFVMIFGAFNDGGGGIFRVALSPDSDTSNVFFQKALKENTSLRFVTYPDSGSLAKDLQKGKLTAILSIHEVKDSLGRPSYVLHAKSTTASNNTLPGFEQSLKFTKLNFEANMPGNNFKAVTIEPTEKTEVRKYRQIDFVLPGQLGFSILFSTLFGISLVFYSLRETLVLKRFYASPIRKINILVGIGISRLFFQLLAVIILVGVGHMFFDFTLVHGLLTFFEIVVMTIIMLFLLMGVGLIFSSIAKSDTNIPLLVNLFGFPQMMLSGTFFPFEVFPEWLQQICKILPLTQYNDAIRKISFEGQHITDCWKELGILAIWIAIIYAAVSRVIKWE